MGTLAGVKTTLDLPDALLDRARRRARERGTTLRSVVAEALRTALDEDPVPPAPFVGPVFDGEAGLQAGVDLGDWDAVRDLAYGRWSG